MKLERVNPHLGARVTGADLTQYTPADREELLSMLDEHQVLFFTGQKLEPLQFLQFAKVIGETQEPDEGAPFFRTMEDGLENIHYIEPGGHPRGGFTDVWHSDLSFFECPTSAAVLQPEILPSIGGDTLWASMYAAYEGLDTSLRNVIDDLKAFHQVNYPDRTIESVHPVVRVNPRTGRRGLFVNRLFTRYIVGMTPVESSNLLELLLQHCTLPDFQLRFSWTPDIVAVWDNRFTLHYAVRDYLEPRRMIRTAIAGERPIGPSEYEALDPSMAA